MTALIVSSPGAEALSAEIAQKTETELAAMSIRQFPDGESYVRFLTLPKNRNVIVVAHLDRPDSKLSKLMYIADGARALGAQRVGLVAPYLAYMRQDKRFNSGEVITSASFAKFMSAHFDWLMTIDPHLHRRASLDEIYSIPSVVLRAAPLLSDWIKANVQDPVLIGPDQESEQWVSAAARQLSCPYRILSKTRRGDRDVEITLPDLGDVARTTPVLLDDTISSAQTMIEAVRLIKDQGLKAPVCCAVHGVFDANALAALKATGPSTIVTTNSISCATAKIDISGLLADALIDCAYID